MAKKKQNFVQGELISTLCFFGLAIWKKIKRENDEVVQESTKCLIVLCAMMGASYLLMTITKFNEYQCNFNYDVFCQSLCK